MTHSDHQLERMRHWSRSYAAATVHACNPAWQGARDDFADSALAEFDKRFPAPTAVEVAPPFNRYSEGYSDGARAARSGIPNETELAALREKARYWDAMWPVWYGQEDDAIHAARKVIDAGALK